jgi:hypothetical protein
VIRSLPRLLALAVVALALPSTAANPATAADTTITQDAHDSYAVSKPV